MPVAVHRQPWFWAVIIAVAAILGFVVVIAASNRDREADSTTIVQQPAPAPDTTVVPVPGTSGSNTPQTPPPPVEPERPVEPARPATPPVKERVIEKVVPVPVPVPSGGTPGATPPGPAGAGDEFQNTGLKRTVQFNNNTFRAQSRATMEESQLKSAGVTEDSVEVFVEMNATEPYTTFYVPIPDEEGAYVRYTRR